MVPEELERKDVKRFQQKVLSYYQKKGRDLPWRHTTDPYKVLLSEVMLQQTQVDRVIPYFERWTKGWPTVDDLAKADRESVLKAWLGLGYNNRAVNLHKTAKIISEEFGGDVIQAMHHPRKLPGIGPYTSAAVRIFAANEDIVTVDTNIRRILIHEFGLDEKLPDKELWSIAEQCLPKGKSRDWHNALMDYGATHLTSRRTGISPKTTQSKFEGSDRQIRARILKKLLRSDERTYSLRRIGEIAADGVAEKRLNSILAGMVRDDLIVKDGKNYRLKRGK